jgi:hypothetical protein
MPAAPGARRPGQATLRVLLGGIIGTFGGAHVGVDALRGQIGDEARPQTTGDEDATVVKRLEQRSVRMMLVRGRVGARARTLGMSRKRIGAVFAANGRWPADVENHKAAATAGVRRNVHAVVRRYCDSHDASSEREALV